MYTNKDIKIGQKFDYPDPDGETSMKVEVVAVDVDMGEYHGDTTLKIYESQQPENKWFAIGKTFSELVFAKHWNNGVYKLIE